MPKAKDRNVPLAIPTLARWLALDPKANVKDLEARLAKAKEDDFAAEREPARVALKWAWDEQPDVFDALLTPWLKATSARLRQVATGALPVTHGKAGAKAVRQLKKMTQDKDRGVRLMAIDLLTEDPNAHMDVVRKQAKTPDPDVKAIVARHLQHVDADRFKKAAEVLTELAVDPSPDVHWAVASTLLELYEREPRPVLEIAHVMAVSGDEGVRSAVASCFFQQVFADNFDTLLPTVRAWLRQPDPNLRWTLCRSLRFVRVTARSLQLLRTLYEDKDPEIRRRVAMFLVDAFDLGGDHYRTIAEMLRRAKEDGQKRVRDVVQEGEERLALDFSDLPVEGEELLEEEGEGEGDEEDDDF